MGGGGGIKNIKEQFSLAATLLLEKNKDFFRFLEGTSPSEYDKIMDSVYTSTYVGGGFHRHFDGTHTFYGSYEAIKEQFGTVEIHPYIDAHFKDLVTPEGLPIFTLDYERHTVLSQEISEALGGNIGSPQIRTFIRDFNSYNIGEVLCASVGTIFLVAAIRSGDAKAISRVTASNICLGIAMANPCQLLLGIYGLAHGIYTGKINSYGLLRGSASTVAGLAGYQVGDKLLNLGIGGNIVLAVGAAAVTDWIWDYIESQKRKKTIANELGKRNSHYVLAMTPDVLEREFFKLLRRSHPLCLASLI